MPSTLPLFQQYQAAFTAHIRSPKTAPRPQYTPKKRMAVYEAIVFNNFFSAVSACFPVAQKVLGKIAWRNLVRHFFATSHCTSPLFREIPKAFVDYLQTQPALPAYLASLCHYEWVELAVATQLAPTQAYTAGNLLQGVPVLATLNLVQYDYNVHQISPRHKPKAALAEPVHLLVFRNAEDVVRFIEINAMTARLVGLLQTAHLTGEQALKTLATEAQLDPKTMLNFGADILLNLQAEGVILGIRL